MFPNRYTPLHQAAQQGHTQIVNLLLENKAEPNAETKVSFFSCEDMCLNESFQICG